MQGQYTIPISRADGKIIRLQIKHKNVNGHNRKVKTWSEQEDNQLIQCYQKYPKRWASISALMGDRNENQCLHRYRRISLLGMNRKIWSAEQDETIRKTIKKVGKNWKLLSQMIGSKTGKQIRERFINKLDPRIKRQEWSTQQDIKLIQLYVQIGSKWSQISKKLPGRPQNKIKNRFYSYIQKNYDIKYMTEEQKRISLRDVTTWQPVISRTQIDDCLCSGFPSIREIQFEVKEEENYEHQVTSHSNLYLRSLGNVDGDWMNFKYVKSFQNFNQNINQFMPHDLFYLPNH